MENSVKFEGKTTDILIKFKGRNDVNLQVNYPHFLYNCGLNLNANSVIECFDEFPMKVTYPLPKYLEPITKLTRNDNAVRLVYEKEKYSANLRQIKLVYDRKKRKNSKEITKHEEANIYPIEVFHFMRALENEVDPYFVGNYDWYFTGGNLEICNTLNGKLLIHAVGPNLDKIRIDSDIYNENLNDINTFQLHSLKENGNIYEIIIDNDKFNFSSNFATRQKNCINIFSLNGHDSITDKWCTELISEAPFIGGAFQMNNKNKFFSVDVDQNLNSWDIQNKKIIDTRQFKTSIDNWSILKNYNKNLFAYADRTNLKLLDLRMPLELDVIKSTFCIKSLVETCEQISCVKKSDFGDLIYIGTSHSLFGVDIRFIKENFNIKPLLKYTHTLKATPVILKTLIYNDIEYILLSSPLDDDLRICTNKLGNVTYYSPHLPFKPYCIRDSFNLTQAAGKCLDPIHPFQTHLNCCTVGMTMYENDNKILIATKNSIGDIFQQFCTDEEIQKKDDVPKKLEYWTEKFDSNVVTSFPITHASELYSLVCILNKKHADELKPEIIHEEMAQEKPKRRPKWRKPIKKLQLYRDFLSADLLSAWELDDDVLDEYDSVKDLPTISENQDDRVSNWLNQMNNNYKSTLQTIKEDESFNINTDNYQTTSVANSIEQDNKIKIENINLNDIFLNEYSQQNNEIDDVIIFEESQLFDSQMLMESQKSQSQSQLRNRKLALKRKYVQGF